MRSFDYRKAIGMLTYSTTVTRPDLAFAVGKLCRSAANPCTRHVGSLKRVFRYIASTVDYGISYERPAETATYPASTVKKATIDCRRDIYEIAPPASVNTNPIVLFRDSGSLVQSLSQKPSNIMAVAVSNTLQEVLPQKSVELKLGIDNQATNVLVTNPTCSRRTRHIELCGHFVREREQKGVVGLHKVSSDNNRADMFTKPLCKHRLKKLLVTVGIGNQVFPADGCNFPRCAGQNFMISRAHVSAAVERKNLFGFVIKPN
ncbi:Uncharacterized protein PHPALM_36448 [Phytophthora palmivora]|uniref:Uncharacterized protein n=1 Tax=Phytophthora palmivora TaxID=4796 RepID=A0A2P4WZX4_9STRA|nr:Uncharacterized protein PHPALM_36448 [Phytophthora palmivora]